MSTDLLKRPLVGRVIIANMLHTHASIERRNATGPNIGLLGSLFLCAIFWLAILFPVFNYLANNY